VGDSVEIAKAVSDSWWLGFSRDDPSQEPYQDLLIKVGD
jgi:hypothetical protein